MTYSTVKYLSISNEGHKRRWSGEKKELKHTDISSENVLNLLLLETTLDDQAASTIDGTTRTQLSEQELHDVLL